MEDSHGFILHSLVCQKTTDDKIAVPMVEATKAQSNATPNGSGFQTKNKNQRPDVFLKNRKVIQRIDVSKIGIIKS
jgi:hypothetical protein